MEKVIAGKHRIAILKSERKPYYGIRRDTLQQFALYRGHSGYNVVWIGVSLE